MNRHGYRFIRLKPSQVKKTLLDNKALKIDNDYLENPNLKGRKLDVFVCQNHEIIFSNYFVIIHTINDNKHLVGYEKALEYIIDSIIMCDYARIVSLCFEASTMDFIKSIKDVERFTNNLKINANIEEEYNIEKKSYYSFMQKDPTVEHYMSGHITSYFNERHPSYVIEESFLTAQYYNQNIGRIKNNILTYLINTGSNILTKDYIKEGIETLKNTQFDLLLSLFSDEYKSELF